MNFRIKPHMHTSENQRVRAASLGACEQGAPKPRNVHEQVSIGGVTQPQLGTAVAASSQQVAHSWNEEESESESERFGSVLWGWHTCDHEEKVITSIQAVTAEAEQGHLCEDLSIDKVTQSQFAIVCVVPSAEKGSIA